jgi:hypothetical protein
LVRSALKHRHRDQQTEQRLVIALCESVRTYGEVTDQIRPTEHRWDANVGICSKVVLEIPASYRTRGLNLTSGWVKSVLQNGAFKDPTKPSSGLGM